MSMNCNLVRSRLHAYVDGEVPPEFMRDIEEHLKGCPSCRSQVERIRQVGGMLDNLAVPPLPREFAARVMAEARRRAPLFKEKKSIFPLGWRPVRWLLDLSFSMRLAACAMVFLAFVLGIFMSKELSLPGNLGATAADAGNLEGFEWFSPTPPASLGSAYVTLAWTVPEERNTP
jgi:anti-sigma factor RsiW